MKNEFLDHTHSMMVLPHLHCNVSHLIVLSCLPDHVPGKSHNTKRRLIVEGHFSGITLMKFLSVTMKSQELQLEELVGMFDAAEGMDPRRWLSRSQCPDAQLHLDLRQCQVAEP